MMELTFHIIFRKLFTIEIKLTKSIQMKSFWREFKQGMTEVKYSLMVERFLFSNSIDKYLFLRYKNKEVSVLNAYNSMSLNFILNVSRMCLDCVLNVSRTWMSIDQVERS